MALQFLADHCVSNFTVQTLREANHEVVGLKLQAVTSGRSTVTEEFASSSLVVPAHHFQAPTQNREATFATRIPS
jgi:hypothetical protein